MSSIIPDAALAAAIRERLGLRAAPSIADVKALTALYAPNEEIAVLDGIEHANQLTALQLGGVWRNGMWHAAPFTHITPLASLSRLTELSIIHAHVTDITPLTKLSRLERLDLEGTPIIDISPLANLKQLTALWLNDTAVADCAPLANLTRLETLTLYNTRVTDIEPLTRLNNLSCVDVTGCALTDESLATHVPIMEANGCRVAASARASG